MLNLFVKVYQVIMQNDNKYSIDNNPVSKAQQATRGFVQVWHDGSKFGNKTQFNLSSGSTEII